MGAFETWRRETRGGTPSLGSGMCSLGEREWTRIMEGDGVRGGSVGTGGERED